MNQIIKKTTVQAPAQAAQTPSQRLVGLINSDAMKAQFNRLMNSEKSLNRFLRIATSTVNQTPKLAECTTESIIGCLLKAAELNLEPNTVTQECFIIPRRNKGRMEANFEVGYKGMMTLSRRSGEITPVEAHAVHENDFFEVDYGENRIAHKPVLKNRGDVICYWARYRMKDDPSIHFFHFMTVEDVEKHRDQYSASNSEYSPWVTAFDRMALKTVIKQLLAHAPISVEDYAHAMAADQQVINATAEQLPASFSPGVTTADLLSRVPEPEALEAGDNEQPEAPQTEVPPPADDRQILLDKIEAMLVQKQIPAETFMEKFGMTQSMLDRADPIELAKIYKKLSK